MTYNQTLSNLRDAIADIQTALNDIGLDGSQSIAGWAEQLETVSTTIQGLRDQVSADDTDFSNIYDAIVQKGQSPDEEDRDTYAPAILAISGGGSNYQSKSITPTAAGLTVTPDTDYDALSSVVIAGDPQLIASNVKKDVEIFGVTGTLEGGSGVSLNAHPSNLQYACTDGGSYANVLPADGSWTPFVDLTGIVSTNNMRYMFYNNTVVEDLDLTGWTIPDIAVSGNYMFSGCSNLKYIRGSLSFAKSTSFNNMFSGCTSLITVGITNFGFGANTTSLTLDLSASSVLDAATLITNMETNSSGKTRILKLHADVLAGLSSDITALAASKNITLQ